MKRHLFECAKGLIFIFCVAVMANTTAAQTSESAPDPNQQAEGDGDVDIQGTKVWSGGGDDDNTSNNRNWRRGGPGAGDFLHLENGVRQTMTHDNAAGTIYTGMSMSGPTDDAGFTVNGNRFGVSDGGFLTSSGVSFFTINTDVDIYGEVTINANTPINFSGVIAGTGSLVKAGISSMELSGDNTFTGGIDFEIGTLIAAHNNALGTGTLTVGGESNDTRTLLANATSYIANDILLNQNLVIDSTANSGVFLRGVISGTGKLILENQPILFLEGNNTFTGGVDFTKGYLIAGHDNAAGTGTIRIYSEDMDMGMNLALLDGVNLPNDINLESSTNILVEETGVATLSGDISGHYGIVLKLGHLILAGDNTFEGTISIETSTLSMTKQLTTTGIYVFDGGTMSGLFGGMELHAYQGNVTPNGDAIGSMQVRDEFSLHGGTLQIQLDNQGNADKIVAGSATLESGTILAKPTEAITGSRQYVIIQTTDGIEGDPDLLTRQVDNDAFLLDFSLAIVGNNVVLNAAQRSSFQEAGRSSGNRQLSTIGLILDNAVSGGSNSDMVAALQGLEERELKTAMGQLQPKLSQAVAMRQMSTQAKVNQQWQSRTQQAHYAMRDAIKAQESTWLAQGPSSPGANPGQDSSAIAAAIELIHDNQPQVGKFVFFAKQLNDFGKVNEDRFASGYSYNAHGVDLGGQMLLSEHFLLGASGSLNTNNIRGYDDSGTAESLTLTANLYASYLTRNWQFDAGISYGHAFNKSERPITALSITADGDYDSDILAFTLGGGYTFDIKGWEINPFGNISYTSVIDHAYTETGAGALNLSISQNHTDSLKPALGLKIGKRFAFNNGSVLAPRLSAAYEYEVLDTQIGVDANMLGGTFRNQGADISRHTVRIGAGGDIQLNKDLTLFVDYVASLNNDFVNHSINAGLRLSF